MPRIRRTAAVETVSEPGDVVVQLLEELTEEMLEAGRTAKARIFLDNPRWGIDPSAARYISSTRTIDVVPWDKKTPLETGVFYLARRIGAYWKVYAGECQD